jgi:DNA-directed RNA polymerase subunit alpha
MARKNLLRGFKRPKGITFEHHQTEKNYGKFIAYPFERGYGTTIGNTLRRVLLSSIQGYAITAIRITRYDEDEVPHVVSSEYDSIPDFVEDIPEIVNNLKQLQLRLPPDTESKLITLELKGRGDFKADRLEVDDIEIVNTDLHIATLSKDANVEMELQIDLGRGYVSAERNEDYVETVGAILVDAIFSPVVKVKYEVENTRVGQRADYDKLNLEVWTDGSITPVDALAEASKIAKDHFTIFINFDEDQISGDDDLGEQDERVRKFLETPVEELELSVRSSNCLKNASIRTIGDLTRKTEEDIVKTRNFGKKSLLEIKEKLNDWNLSLGMKDYSDLKIPDIKKMKKEAVDEA